MQFYSISYVTSQAARVVLCISVVYNLQSMPFRYEGLI